MLFIKKTNTLDGKDLLAEAEGITAIQQLLTQHAINELMTPTIKTVTNSKLEMTHIQQTSPTPEQWQQLGTGLAKLHNIKQTQFGWHSDNFIGLGQQLNVLSNDWATFFIDYRLTPQIDRITDHSIKEYFLQHLATSQSTIIDLLGTVNEASLLHGDLWSGNVLFSNNKVWLIDPAVYYGDAEVDIAFTEMFGRFNPLFYQSYFELRPRSNTYHKKKIIYNLYHYLNHYNIFGGSYLQGCEQAFEQILAVSRNY